jgi:hypothetical protein
MARQSVVLFGAGASMDAGLPDAHQLTRKVYAKLREAKSDDARLFGLIVSKLLVRHVRMGGSPYDDINVEDAYDALKKFIHRDVDLISEFVQAWDPISAGGLEGFDAKGFAENMALAFSLEEGRRFDGRPSFNVNQRNIVAATEKLQQAFGGDFFRLRGASLEPFLTTLSTILNAPDENLEYMENLLRVCEGRTSCIATLNYDRIVERSYEKIGSKFDLGLSQWNDKRYVKFHGQAPKLIKLHGSVDWFLRNEDEIDVGIQVSAFSLARAMVFGGQNEKLVPHGPFLHLRHEFQRLLRDSSSLLVVGYSFGDSHLNAIIRSWVAAKTNARMMVVNPRGFPANHPVMRYSKDRRNPKSAKPSVRLEVVPKGTAESLDKIEQFLSS